MFEGESFIAPGLTLDALLAFAATGTGGDHVDPVFAWLAQPEVTANYLGQEFGSRFAGSYAKLAFTAGVFDQDPSSFGGVDLLAELRELEDDTGRFSDESDFADNSGSFSQSFAILALRETPEGVSAAAVDRLVAEQCPDGGFPQVFGGDACESGADPTAVAVAALLATGQAEAAQSALDWLAERQEGNGGFRSHTAPDGAADPINANSTGLAAQALRAGGREPAAEDAVAFLRGLQVGCDGPVDERGAIHLTEDDPGDVPRATTQAILGLAGVGMADLDGTALQPEAGLLACQPDPSPTATPPPGGTGGEKLPTTGSPVLALAGAGVLLTAVGGAAVWATRRRQPDLAEPTV